MEHCISFIEQAELTLVEGALIVISEIAKKAEKNFSTYNKATREAIRSFLNNSGQKHECLKEQAGETWSIIDQAVGKEEVKKLPFIPAPIEKPEKMVEVQTISSDMGDVSTDYEIVPLAQARGRRASKKPSQTYEEKTIEEQKEKLEKQEKQDKQEKPKKTRNASKKLKETPIKEEEEDMHMEVEKPNSKLRTEVGYEWREWQLSFNEALNSLTSEEFISFIKMVQEDKPECVSFDKGYLELKIAAAKVLPPVSQNTHAKTNQMMIQTKTFMEFIGYIEKIKGNSNNIVKPRPKKNTKAKV
jgi:hypothetical protein